MTRYPDWTAFRRTLIPATVLAALLLAVVALSAGAARADTVAAPPCTQTVISDTITWPRSQSPCSVTTTFTVVPGVNLTIEPGVRVLFAPGAGLRIEGSLDAQGSHAEQIRLSTAPDAPAGALWSGITLAHTSGAVRLRSVTIANAATGLALAQQSVAAAPPPRVDIQDSLFSSNTIAISVPANAPRMRLRNSLLMHNGIGMLVQDPGNGSGTLKVRRNSFIDNGIALKVLGQGSVTAKRQWWGADGPVIGIPSACAATPAPGASDDNLICGSVDFTPPSRTPAGRMILNAGAGGVLESEIGLAAQSDDDTAPTSIATVSVPAGAFTQQVDLLASGRMPSEMPPVQAGLRPTQLFLEVTAVAGEQEIHQFANGRRLELTINYTQQDLDGVDPSKLVLYYWDEARQTWSFQGLSTTVEPANQRIVVRLEHLSRMGTMGVDLGTGWLPLLMR